MTEPPNAVDTNAGDGAHEAQHHGALYEAAIEAELETGVHEETEEAARGHIVVRLLRIIAGFTVLVIGIIAIPLPGPGWLIIGVGLAILARDFVWAERTLQALRKRLPQSASGDISTRTWVSIGVVTTAGIGASVWWSFLRT